MNILLTTIYILTANILVAGFIWVLWQIEKGIDRFQDSDRNEYGVEDEPEFIEGMDGSTRYRYVNPKYKWQILSDDPQIELRREFERTKNIN